MKRRKSATEQKLTDDARLLRGWAAWQREEREAVLAGPHGAVLGDLFRMTNNLKHVQPTQLLDFVRAIDWSAIDYATKLTVIHEINAAIVKLRTVNRLAPFDDGLPGEPDTPFRTICAIVLTTSPLREGVHRDAARSE
jgi:hypothetical protein